MEEVIFVFGFLAAVVFAGFLGELFFRKTRFPDFILLMILGLLVGPGFGLLDFGSISFLKQILPFFSATALIIILFEGGLRLNFYRVLRELPKSTLFSLLVFLLSVVLVTFSLVLFEWDFLSAVLVATILGGTSSAVIIPLISGISAKEETKTLLSLESSLTDAITIIATLAVVQVILAQNIQWQELTQTLFAAFFIAGALGIVGGIIWIKIMRDYAATKQYEFILSLGALFLLYSLTEFAGGNGAISALVFGLVLGNAPDITRILRIKEFSIDESMTLFQHEISLFVRTFFFIYIGLIFSVQFLDLWLVRTAVIIAVVLYAARYIGVKILLKFKPSFSADRKIISTSMARGLAAAVLASYPLSVGIEALPDIQKIPEIAFIVILLTSIAATWGVFTSENKKEK